MIKDRDSSSKMYMTLETHQNDLIQGKFVNENTVEMVRYQDEDPDSNSFFFCIVRNASKYHFTRKSSYIKDPNNKDPAGGSSVGKKLSFFSE